MTIIVKNNNNNSNKNNTTTVSNKEILIKGPVLISYICINIKHSLYFINIILHSIRYLSKK